MATEFLAGWTTRGPLALQSMSRTGLLILVGLAACRWQHLYKSGLASVRTAELAATVKAAVATAFVGMVLDEVAGIDARWLNATIAAALATLFLNVGRSLYRSWLRAHRSRGNFTRSIVVVGANAEARRLVGVLADHPEAGFALAGVCGDIDSALATGLRSEWRGDPEHAVDLVRRGEVTGAIVVASALSAEELNRVVRGITAAGGHVHLASGLRGIDSRRISSESIAHEPLLHLHPQSLAPHQAVAKRCIDVVIAATTLAVTAPLLAAVALAVKLGDGGPVLFRQTRVGLDGRHFKVLKFRTMVVDAEARLSAMMAENLRQGPLFKLDRDPRVTSIGRVLRATSIDELPQLWNVLRGEMSLVGPRPALPAEVEQFSPELRQRAQVLPGLTGLWQVEARDNPSFEAYERLDLFYVENWSPTFDLIILLATVESELARVLGRLFNRGETIDLRDGIELAAPTLGD